MKTRMEKYATLREKIEKEKSKHRFSLITKEVEDAYYNLFKTTLEGDIKNREEKRKS